MATQKAGKKAVNFAEPKSLEEVMRKKGAARLKRHGKPGPKFFLALNILEFRKRREWTQAQAAKKAGVAFNTYVNIEQAQPTANPTADNLIKLAEAFGVSVSELWKERKMS